MFKEKIKLISKKDVCDGVVEFEFNKPVGFEFKAGQYVNLYISGAEVAHGKSYTIISSPSDKNLKFSIRKRGPFSTHLHNLDIGGEMILEGPEGNFLFEEYENGVIFIAAGIGIAPLISYMRFLEDSKDLNKEIKVLFTNKTEFSTPYKEYLTDKRFKNLNTKFFYTEDGGNRIDKKSVEEIIKNNDLPIFICGSINFTNDFWKMLLSFGVEDERIVTEAFF